MATWQYELSDPPTEPRARELWLQHAAGFIVFEDVRRYAMERMELSLSNEVRDAVQKGIDDTVYGLMMVIEGVTGSLANENYSVHIDFIARLLSRKVPQGGEEQTEIDLREGDGMCMGYHGWIDGDFGEDQVAIAKTVE
jgi:hypothetical protein